MSYDIKMFYNRLDKIWQPPNFFPFFEKYSKRKPLHIKKGAIIFYEGDQPERLYFIKKGFVKLYHLSKDGKSTVIYLYGPGAMLGLRALTSKDRCLKHNAEAITDVEVTTISRNDYLEIISKDPIFLVDLLDLFIERLNQTEKKLEGFITTDATSRIASFLLDLTLRFGKIASVKNKHKIIIPIPLTHQLIAEFVGSVRETVTDSLHLLEKKEILKIKKGEITILDLQKLSKYISSHRK